MITDKRNKPSKEDREKLKELKLYLAEMMERSVAKGRLPEKTADRILMEIIPRYRYF